MRAERVERRLAAILAADVAGYSRLMGLDEAGTLARLNALRRELIDPQVAEHKGRIVKTTGDGILVEFPSVVEAVACALAVQQGMASSAMPRSRKTSASSSASASIRATSIVEDGDIHGDGVNVAARLEALAEPGAICVSAIVQSQVEGRLDCAFEDMGEQSLKNIARPVRVYRVGPTSPHPDPPPLAGRDARRRPSRARSRRWRCPTSRRSRSCRSRTSAATPSRNISPTAWSRRSSPRCRRIRWLFVIARNSSFTYKGQAVDVKQVGRELGVRYVLEGSVRKGGSRVRITAQLIEAETGAHLWADRFDGLIEDVFELQDKVAFSAVGVIESTLQVAEIKRSTERPTADPNAYDLYLRALPDCLSWDPERIRSALNLLERAIERDPKFGPALALAAVCHHHLDHYGGAAGPRRISPCRARLRPACAASCAHRPGHDHQCRLHVRVL